MPMEVMILFRDWFYQPTLEAEPNLGQELSDLRAGLARQFSSFSSYDFLPLGFMEASEAEVRMLASSRLIRFIMPASDGWKFHRDTFQIVLSGLNALRSQTGYQVFQWYLHVANGGTLPDDRFEGGWWPPHSGYPRVGDLTSGRLEADGGLVLGAAPAWLPVINLSLEPTGVAYEANDPVGFALASMAPTHLVVIAAGNRGSQAAAMNPWAASEGSLAVGATEDEAGARLAPYSSRGSPDNQVRGPDVVTWGETRSGARGTSFAAPRVAMMGVLCAALMAQVQYAWLLAQGVREYGVPLMGWGLLDLENVQDLPERLEAPALPILGVRLEAMVQALREVNTRISLQPAILKRLLLAAARPMPGYGRNEVGAGYISEALLLEHLAKVTVGEVVRWFNPQAPVRPALASELAFDEAGLHALSQITRRTAPTWFWDYARRAFIVNGRIVPFTGAEFNYDTFRQSIFAARNGAAGHGFSVVDTGTGAS
jgi:hypothetical protein